MREDVGDDGSVEGVRALGGCAGFDEGASRGCVFIGFFVVIGGAWLGVGWML